MSFARFAASLPSPLSLVGRTALVTGASSGVGRQCALHLARAGAAVLCTDIKPTPNDAHLYASEKTATMRTVATHEVINNLGGRAAFLQADVRSEGDWAESVEKAVALSGETQRLDILLNNAGLTKFAPGIENESMDAFQTLMDINVKGAFLGTKYAIKQMLKQDPIPLPADGEQELDAVTDADADPASVTFPDTTERGSRGTIIQIGSIHGLVGGPHEPAYCAAKGAVINLTRQVAFDYAPQRINCNAICPGYLRTALTANVSPELEAIRPTYWPHRGSARDVAKAVLYFARDSPWSTGTILTVDGGTTCR